MARNSNANDVMYSDEVTWDDIRKWNSWKKKYPILQNRIFLKKGIILVGLFIVLGGYTWMQSDRDHSAVIPLESNRAHYEAHALVQPKLKVHRQSLCERLKQWFPENAVKAGNNTDGHCGYSNSQFR